MDPKEPTDKDEKKPDFAEAAKEKERVRSQPRFTVVPPSPSPRTWKDHLSRHDFNLSDRNLALCVKDKHGEEFKFSANRACWLSLSLNNKERWIEDQGGGLILQGKVSDQLNDDGFNPLTKKVKDKMRLGSTSTVRSVMKQLESMLRCDDDIWDRDPMLLNCPGGTYDARTGQLREHRREDYITKVTIADPEGECPLWLKHIDFVTGRDAAKTEEKQAIADEFARYLKALSGYALFGAGREQIIPFIYGDTNNGKSTFLRALATAMGDYGVPDFPAEALMLSRQQQHREIFTALMGARLAISTEVPDDAMWNTILLKKLSGNEMITANKMFQNSTTFLWSGVLMLAGNSAPSFKAIDGAIKRRMQVIPFDAHVEASQRDRYIDDKLKAEAGGILRWMIEGYEIYRADGRLVMPEAVRKATDEYIESQDNIKQWIDECCQVNISFTMTFTYKELHASYAKWAEDSKLPYLSKGNLTTALRRLTFGPPEAPFKLVENKINKGMGFRRIALKSGND